MSNSPAAPAPSNGTPNGSPPPLDLLSADLFKVVAIILVFVGLLLIGGLAIQTWSYYGGIHAATTTAGSNQVDHAAVITYARGLGAAFIKTSALFLGFVLIFTGTLYVLRTAEANFDLEVATGQVKGALHTASPGLVIVTLGVALTMAAIMVKSDLDYEKTTEVPLAGNAPSASNTPNFSSGSAAPGAPSAPPDGGGK
jgi:hypothetical protein